jgi:HEAT repeat protein
MAIRRQFAQALEALAAGAELRSVQIPLFSDISRDETRALREAWPTLPAGAREDLVLRAAELAEDNVELEFASLLRVATADSEAAIRRRAAEGLWESDDPDVARELSTLLESDPDEAVRGAAATALRRFVLLRELDQVPEALGDDVVNALLAAAADETQSIDVRSRALESAGARSLPLVSTLITDAHYDDDRRFRLAALRAMGESADDRWLDILADEAESEDPAFRFEAAVALGQIGAEEGLSTLFGLVEDEDREVALAAVAALAEVATPEAEERLRELIEAGEEPLAKAAAAALDMISQDGEDV